MIIVLVVVVALTEHLGWGHQADQALADPC
jgi:hypothetical protein